MSSSAAASLPYLSHFCDWCGCRDGDVQRARTTAPNFGEIAIASFTCNECGLKSSTVHPAASPRPNGFRVSMQAQNIEVSVYSTS